MYTLYKLQHNYSSKTIEKKTTTSINIGIAIFFFGIFEIELGICSYMCIHCTCINGNFTAMLTKSYYSKKVIT